MEIVFDRFADEKHRGFYFTADDQEQLIVRSKDFTDNAVPSGNAMAATVLTRLGKYTGSQRYTEAAAGVMRQTAELMRRAPTATGQALLALDLELGPTYELVLAGNLDEESSQAILADLRGRFLPNKVLAFTGAGADSISSVLDELLRGKTMQGGAATLYVCEGFTCQAPARGQEEIEHTLDELMPPGSFD